MVSNQAQQNPPPRHTGRYGPNPPTDWARTESGGPKPFVSWVAYRLTDGTRYTWQARHHRKGAGPRTLYADRVGLRTTRAGTPIADVTPWRRFWAPERLAWWVAITSIVGSVFFVLGAAGSLIPAVFGGHNRMSIFAEANYFAGATLYTVGIYAQLLEGLNNDERIDPNWETHAPARFRWFISQLSDLARLEILIPFTFLIGSLVFNYETTDSLGSSLGLLPNIGLWETSLIGSILFALAGLLQFIEAGHHYLCFAKRDISWWIGAMFTVGGAGFVIGCLPGLHTPGLPTAKEGSGPLIVKLGFLIGGVAYGAGSYLMLPELFTELRRHRTGRT